MNINQAKTIKLEVLLSKYGHEPAKQSKNNIWYISPLRTENTPSFKVNTALNTRYDFGLSMGGDVVKFICDFKNTDIKGALRILDSSSWGVGQSPAPQKIINIPSKPSNSLVLLGTQAIHFYPLKQYLQSRRIHPDVYHKYLVQVHYSTASGARLVALGFQTDSGGYEVRNKLFKGFVGKNKSLTSLNIDQHQNIYVFEGFFDFLAFATRHRQTKSQYGCIILNGIAFVDHAIEKLNSILTNNTKIILVLDNDPAGREAVGKIQTGVNTSQIYDIASEYSNYKDYSEWWMSDKNISRLT